MNLKEARQQIFQKLTENGIDSPGTAVLLLLRRLLGRSKSWILTHGEVELSPSEISTLHDDLERVLQGVPLPYIIGRWEFFGRTFTVTPDVLIPRPETELLVEKALQSVQADDQLKIADVGTGSGIIAVSLAAELPKALVIAIDISSPALRIARDNARQHGQTQIRFVQSDLLSPFRIYFDLICANLPYIPTQKLKHLPVARSEPRMALDGGESGLEVISRLLQQAGTRLALGGRALFEIEASLGRASLTAAQAAFPDAHCTLHQDLAGNDRILEIHLS